MVALGTRLTAPGTALADFDFETKTGMGLVAPSIALVALDTDMVGSDIALGLGTQAGIGGFFALSASTELKLVPCHQ